MSKALDKSNIEIKSNGGRHSVFVDGVKMDSVFSVAVDYTILNLPVVTIKAYLPNASTKSEYKDND